MSYNDHCGSDHAGFRNGDAEDFTVTSSFFRYVDDIAIPSSIEQVVLNKFNSYHLRLQFMLEIYNNSIKFLDMMILKQ